MTLDPFAPQETAQPQEEAPVTVNNTAPRPSLDEGKVVITLKGGPGFEAPWIVVHANSVADADSVLDAKMAELMGKVQRAAESFRGSAPVQPASAAPASRPLQPSQPAASNQPPPNAPACPGDGWEWKSGVSAKNGKPWKGWMPPRGSGLDPIFVRD